MVGRPRSERYIGENIKSLSSISLNNFLAFSGKSFLLFILKLLLFTIYSY